MSIPVIRLTDRVPDVRYETVQSTLARALEYVKPGGAYQERGYVPTRCVIVLVDEHDGSYKIGTLQSAGTISETIALLDLAKICEARSMGFFGEE